MPIFKAVSHESCTSFALNQMGSEKSPKHEFREHTKEGEKRFNEILDVLEELFTEEFKARGGELKMARYEWPFNSLNIRMRREHFGNDGDIWRVIPTGGIFRHKMIDEDAFTLITCHEIGHHIGGLPLKRSPLRGQFHWATTEGQADYFAASKCFRQYAEVTGGNEKFATKEFHIEDELLDEKVFERCQAIFSSREEAAICSRTIRAGIVLTRFMAHYRGMSPEKLSPHDEDPQVLERTHDGTHP